MPARRAPSMPGAMTFRFLSETRRIVEKPWGVDAPSQFWRYNLHCFDDLSAFEAGTRHRWHVEAIANWIRDNPPGNSDAWAPYPTSLRVVNWIKWALGGAALEAPAVHSLAMQVRALSRRLEYHLLGNHLFANAKALVLAGLFFEGREGERWLESGAGIAIPPEDAMALARSVTALTDNRERCVALGLKGRRYASDKFSREMLAMRMLAELEQVGCRNRSHRS